LLHYLVNYFDKNSINIASFLQKLIVTYSIILIEVRLISNIA